MRRERERVCVIFAFTLRTHIMGAQYAVGHGADRAVLRGVGQRTAEQWTYEREPVRSMQCTKVT